MTPPVDTVLAFMDRINQRDPDAIADLMTEDHIFIDSLGQTVHGRERMRAGWRGYYTFCPDYSVSYEQILPNGNLVAIFGAAGGTINGTAWRIPSAWLAIVENDRVKEWRVYADNKPVYEIVAKSKSRSSL
jgi:ketosteroid isomerase-like protein